MSGREDEELSGKKEASGKIIELILSGKISRREDFVKAKRRLSKEHKLEKIITNSDILSFAGAGDRKSALLLSFLARKPVRTISGVAVVAVMSRLAPCPGKCVYCPENPSAPKSYTGKEPAAMRASMCGFDPEKQVSARIRQLEAIGHPTDKIELIIMGGTFPSLPKEYQESFVKECFDAMNGLDGKRSASLEEAQKANEKAAHRCVGLTIETRPDYCSEDSIREFLRFGATRIELGVQTLSDEVYDKVCRGHSVADVASATQRLKDSGLKVCYHYMPGLFVSPEDDVRMFSELFSDPRFRPDMLKIYPVLVIRGTKLCEMWEKGEYAPYDNETAATVIAEMKTKIPPYCRLMRIQRDIPAYNIVAGVTSGNLRELVQKKLADKGWKCGCIRCREAGHLKYVSKQGSAVPGSVRLSRTEYEASGGREVFLSFEDAKNRVLLGYLRLRFPGQGAFMKELRGSAIVRELRVVGQSVPLGERSAGALQHTGLGRRLLSAAEKEAKKRGFRSIAVISAVGTREYYKKFGYELAGPYVRKALN